MKSFLDTLSVTVAGHAHGCQHNQRHRITKGQSRLTAKVEMTKEHFCGPCAIKFLKNDIEKIKALIAQLEAGA